MDFNAIFSTALSNAVEAALTKIQAPLVAKIDSLEEAIAELQLCHGLSPSDKLTHASSSPALHPDGYTDLSTRLSIVEGTLSDAVKVLGAIVMIDDLPSAAQRCRDDDEHMPTTSSAFDCAVAKAIENAPDDAIDALSNGDTAKLLTDGVGDAVAAVIRNGEFNVRFSTY